MIIPIKIDRLPPTVEFRMDIDRQNACDEAILHYLMKGGPPEPEVINAFKKIVRPGDIVIDGGANVGFHTLVLSQLVGPKGKVIAIEPGSNNLPKLKANLALNNCRNVEVVEAALGAYHAPSDFCLRADGGENSFRGDEVNNLNTVVNVVTLAEFMNVNARLIKLDIEGAELEVLNHHFPSWVPFFIVEMNIKLLKASGIAQLRRLMGSRGLHTFLLNHDGFLPVMVPPSTVFTPTRENTNVLFSTHEEVGAMWNEVVIG